MNSKIRFGLAMPLFLFLYTIANGSGATAAHDEENGDPAQRVNRIFYGINDVVDKAFVEPVAEAYVAYIPDGIRTGVSNFFDNLGYLGVVINDVLQGKIERALKDTGRFVVNSTIGIGGIFDPATHMGLARHEEDFGQTLGVWGADEGAYLVLPALGPSSVRDVPGVVMGFFTNLLYYMESSALAPLLAFYVIDYRADLLTAAHSRDESLDPYIFMRDAYRQRQTYLIHDGNPPLELIDLSEIY
uniref:Phospholipid-binding lipoprotein MlaA n=1 Tax=Candidatus Kentrum eta TaxID=2126337 RepID=A0A450VI71_9GAMM|nr:MAG: phospholipid-binding lipoprotein MlaA [Candidatus Kentron sp. H]VFK04427.1 MAG: phospholipid-binding lipoprotein MlaA [Candidatus Kentron sp. H]VFK07416.1 MAG: phospholipid-binding lipoprotein MlaA [Candidatus Kentron sp. H]